MRQYDSDALDSDDLEEILQMSMVKAQSQNGHASRSSKQLPMCQSGPSGQNSNGTTATRRQELQRRKERLRAEIRDVEEKIEKLTNLRSGLEVEWNELNADIQLLDHPVTTTLDKKGKARAEIINYQDDLFNWSGDLRTRLREVFGIENFRLCQEGVCNANLNGRDIVCVMPTGGGKSLTYQLPALFCPGCTLVISPLISLITDQILHLREVGVEAVMLTGTTSEKERHEIYTRLESSVGGSFGSQRPEIKLCYVTPEKLVKSDKFRALLGKIASNGKLARIVIDEAHCVSQMGHAFRRDYHKLNILRQLFPKVPILALSATCPPKVLQELVKILRLKPVVGGKAATEDGTVYFTSPLYRKNLHYAVLPKSESVNDSIKAMADYILEKHKMDSGIVYCLSRKDAENVAKGLTEQSGGLIRTGVYHAFIDDEKKLDLHKRWREGEVKVVCATIAFGMGIDKGDVRFVLHHSIPKSLDGYYQETGRAGRDGKDADCVLFYRPQDGPKISKLGYDELGADEKLREMLRFAQDFTKCRKIQFARYFSVSSSLDMRAWETEEVGANDNCGHCDNCTRPPETVSERDVTVETWQILRVAEHLEKPVTLAQLAKLVRGVRAGITHNLDLDVLIGGKVSLSGHETECLIVHLFIEKYLKEKYVQTPKGPPNVYLEATDSAYRYTSQRPEDIRKSQSRIVLSFLIPPKKGMKRKRGVTVSPKKGVEMESDSEGSITGSLGIVGQPSSDDEGDFLPKSKLSRIPSISSSSDESSDSDLDSWQTRLRRGFKTVGKSFSASDSQRHKTTLSRTPTLRKAGKFEPEVIVLSD